MNESIGYIKSTKKDSNLSDGVSRFCRTNCQIFHSHINKSN